MFISSFRLCDYKSYLDQELSLSKGVNLIVGQNDAGKTALLEGLSLNFQNKPHRNSEIVLTANEQSQQESNAIVSFTIGKDELWDILRKIPGQFFVPLPDNDALIKSYNREHPDGASEVDLARAYIKKLFNRPEFTFRVHYKTRENPSLTHVPEWHYGANAPLFPALQNYEVSGSTDKRRYAPCQITASGNLIIDNEDKFLDRLSDSNRKPFDFIRKASLLEGQSNEMDFGLKVAESLRNRVYLFQAQRKVEGKCRQEYSSELKSDASNLASFLANLQKTPAVFGKLKELLRTILPQIHEVATRNLPHETILSGQRPEVGFQEILIYQKDGDDEAYAISLDDSGTGVGQVLAILSILVTSKYSRTIIIDEPQSFLHPGAVRKLIDVLKRFPHHQYIISTHSTQVITASNPSIITLITKEPGRPSILKNIDPSVQNDLNTCLETLGARLSDVFEADRVLWVEGKTEAKCFPLIVEKLLKQPLLGTAIVGVDSTSDLQGKDADRVIKIYERLSKGPGLVPRALGFIFDREGKPKQQRDDLKRRLGGDCVRFLERAMIENYFLDAEAIAEVMKSLGGFSKRMASTKKIGKWLNEKLDSGSLDNAQRKRYYFKNNLGERDENIKTIHAANILKDLFSEFSGNTVEYNKVEHGRMITEWLIANRSNALSEVKALLYEMLNND